MSEYWYRAVNPAGKIVTGALAADSLIELETRLGKQKLELITGKEHKPLFQWGARKTVSRREMINFCFHMEQLTGAGVPVLESLKDLQESLERGYFQQVIGGVVEGIEEGRTFSQALEAYPSIFPPSFTSIVKAGEYSGELPVVMKDLMDSIKWQDELIAQTKKALTYPTFVGVVVIAVVFFLMIYLVPQMLSFITSMGQEIPLYTRALLFVSNCFVNYWHLMIAIPVVTLVGLRIAMKRSEALRILADRLILKVWVLGPILEKIQLARFSNHFALLYNSGVTVLDSLKISQEIVSNRMLRIALNDARQQIADGSSISEAFEQTCLFPRLVVRMLGVGENTGKLGDSILNVSYFYKRDVDDSIDRMQTLIEPAMTVILGLILGWVMMAVLGPIYDLMTKIET